MPWPWVAETGCGLAQAEAMELGGQLARRPAVDLVGDDDDGPCAAAQDLGDLGVARAAARLGRRPPEPRRRRRRSPPAPGAGRPATASRSAARSTPPVSTSAKATPFHSQSSALRSRVTPASRWTTASRPPASRLTSVDLPTLGKPTTAICGRRPHATSPRSRASAAIRVDDLVHVEARGVDLDRVVGGAQGAVLALASRASRTACAASTSRACSPVSAARRRARSAGSRSGRPSAAHPGPPRCRCRGPRRRSRRRRSARAGGRPSPRAPRGGPRRARRRRTPRARGSPRSRPRRRADTRRVEGELEAARRARRRDSPSSRSVPARIAARATHRYIAPESR